MGASSMFSSVQLQWHATSRWASHKDGSWAAVGPAMDSVAHVDILKCKCFFKWRTCGENDEPRVITLSYPIFRQIHLVVVSNVSDLVKSCVRGCKHDWRVLPSVTESPNFPSLANLPWRLTYLSNQGSNRHHWIIQACSGVHLLFSL